MKKSIKNENKISVFRIIIFIIGLISGVVGGLHGFLEIQQGNIKPGGIVIDALNDGNIPMPAMTLIPNFLITGIIALIVGFSILVWVILFIQRKNCGYVMILLSILLLLVGGGFAPPGLGILSGIISIWINKNNNQLIK